MTATNPKLQSSAHSTAPKLRRLAYGITSRESQVLDLLVEGLSGQKIADRLGVRFYTVTTHMKSIYKKLGAHNRAQVVGKVLTEGILHGQIQADIVSRCP